jgi:hypothetical protein
VVAVEMDVMVVDVIGVTKDFDVAIAVCVEDGTVIVAFAIVLPLVAVIVALREVNFVEFGDTIVGVNSVALEIALLVLVSALELGSLFFVSITKVTTMPAIAKRNTANVKIQR